MVERAESIADHDQQPQPAGARQVGEGRRAGERHQQAAGALDQCQLVARRQTRSTASATAPARARRPRAARRWPVPAVAEAIRADRRRADRRGRRSSAAARASAAISAPSGPTAAAGLDRLHDADVDAAAPEGRRDGAGDRRLTDTGVGTGDEKPSASSSPPRRTRLAARQRPGSCRRLRRSRQGAATAPHMARLSTVPVRKPSNGIPGSRSLLSSSASSNRSKVFASRCIARSLPYGILHVSKGHAERAEQIFFQLV